jgi:hypothetical protein
MNERFFPFPILLILFIVPILLFEPTDTPDIGRFICEDDEFFMFSIVA